MERPTVVDYPEHPKFLAPGDLLCFEGEWRRVASLGFPPGSSWPPTAVFFADDHHAWDNQFPLPRIAGPLLPRTGDPYRVASVLQPDADDSL